MSIDKLAKGLNNSYGLHTDNALRFSKQIIDLFPSDLNPEKGVIKFVSDESLKSYFGGGDAPITIIRGQKKYDIWMMELWGRRCSYYISQLSKGIKFSNNILSNKERAESTAISNDLENVKNILNERFRIERNPRFSASISLDQRRDVANFHVTYLDPILFSSLYVLLSEGEYLTHDQKRFLYESINKEFSIYTNNGERKVGELIADESTIWWAFVEIVKRTGIDSFLIGKNKGRDGAIKVCLNLINNNNTIFPDRKMVLMEATPEIYGKTRTSMLLVKNAIEFVKLADLSPYESDADRIFDYINRQISYIFGCSSIDEHAYLNGLYLESLSFAYDIIVSPNMRFFDKLEKFLKTASGDDDLETLKNNVRLLCDEGKTDLKAGSSIMNQLKQAIESIDKYSDLSVKKLSKLKKAYDLWEFFS